MTKPKNNSQRGHALVEYAIVLLIIAIGCVFALRCFGINIGDFFKKTTTTMDCELDNGAGEGGGAAPCANSDRTLD